MRMHLVSPLLLCCAALFISSARADDKTSTIDACSLLTQEEVNQLFGKPAGPGKPDSPAPEVSSCSWPAGGAPEFLVQVVRAPDNVRDSVDMGDGYRIVELHGLSGPAAVSIQKANPEYGLKEGVAILGIATGKHMVLLSPVLLDIQEGTPRFDLLQQLADKAIQRL